MERTSNEMNNLSLGLEDILAPVSPQVFVDALLDCKVLHIPANEDKFVRLFDIKRFYTAVESASRRRYRRGQFAMSALLPDDLGEGLTVSQPITLDQVTEVLNARYSICVNDIGVGDSILRDTARRIGMQIGLPGCVRFNCYLSRNKAVTQTHIDTRATNTLQISGFKRWRFMERPAVCWPRSNAQITPEGEGRWLTPGVGADEWEKLYSVNRSEFKEVTLGPGDMLCLPAGTWHEVESLDDSLALNLSIRQQPLFELLADHLTLMFTSKPEWRSGFPPTLADGAGKEHAAKYIRDRVCELRDYFEQLENNPERLEQIWTEWTGRESE